MFEKKYARIHNDLLRNLKDQYSLQELRLLIVLISTIKSSDWELNKDFSVKFYCEYLKENYGINLNPSRVKQDFLSLTNKKVTLKVYREEMTFTFIELQDDSKETGYFSYKFNSLLNEYFIGDPKNYTKFQVNEIMKYKDKYALKLYIRMKSYSFMRKIDSKYTITFNFDSIREYLNLKKHKTYSINSKFKNKILTAAFDTINSLSDIRIIYTFLRGSREFTHVRIGVIEKQSEQYCKEYLDKLNKELDFVLEQINIYLEPLKSEFLLKDIETNIQFAGVLINKKQELESEINICIQKLNIELDNDKSTMKNEISKNECKDDNIFNGIRESKLDEELYDYSNDDFDFDPFSPINPEEDIPF